MKRKCPEVVYKSLWTTATEEQKKEYQERIDQAFDIIFDDVDRDLAEKLCTKNKVNNTIKSD